MGTAKLGGEFSDCVSRDPAETPNGDGFELSGADEAVAERPADLEATGSLLDAKQDERVVNGHFGKGRVHAVLL